jgi:TPP-dependent pyruvate/acetoin dehydrogenase alpha subunit
MNHGYTKETLAAFEEKIKAQWESGNLPCLLHLSGGEEEILLHIFDRANEGDWFFGSHRSHYIALLAGMTEKEVWDGIHRGDSMFLYSRQHRLYVSAILAGCCGIAVGVAVANKAAGNGQHCHVFIGDGAEEQGAFYEAVLYATGHDLPVTFHILDNDRQVDTDKLTRRGMNAGLLDHAKCVRRYEYQATYPHGGSGTATIIDFKDKTPQWAELLHQL